MKVFLMFPERDFDSEQQLPWQADTLTDDLDLGVLFDAMAAKDEVVREVVPVAVLAGTTDSDVIAYRQAIMADCIEHADTVRSLYQLASDTIEAERKNFHFGKRPASMLRGSVASLKLFADKLGQLRKVTDSAVGRFESNGLTRLFERVQAELDDDYLATVRRHLDELEFTHGVLASARLGPGNKGVDYVLRQLSDKRRGWTHKLLSRQPESYTFAIDSQDESGSRQLAEMEDRLLAPAAAAAGEAADHILSFFKMLRTELAFYVGCLNLRDKLESLEAGLCFPGVAPMDERQHTFAGLYDICLQLRSSEPVVANDFDGDGRALVFITGANRGGKSTFLRAIGVAQLMMQCGMFVPATSFAANLCYGVFTHYKHEEDASMVSGKFQEELGRMDRIVNHLTENALMLFNESFSATNEREGSEIAGQIVATLVEKGIKVFFVTHFYELAAAFYDPDDETRAFLRADRGIDGQRTFKLVTGEPLTTGYGQDLYARIFGSEPSIRSIKNPRLRVQSCWR